jgi:hypothetical protein
MDRGVAGIIRGSNMLCLPNLGVVLMKWCLRSAQYQTTALLSLLLAVQLCSVMYAQQPQFDGPAELPRVYVKSALTDTPAAGKTISVHAGDNLQPAINKAECGDTIELQSGETFTGAFRFPQKPCDDAHWIIVRTSAPNSALPPEGTRLKPCFAGVASLPGRPDFHCTATQNVLAKLELRPREPIGPIVFDPGANHYRFIGLEITRTGDTFVSALATVKGNGEADHIVFDRVWMHGTAQDETTRAIYLVGMSYVAVVDSFLNDFVCVSATGSCTDSQAIATGGGHTPSGPFKIVNNFLEAAGENIIFGGTPASATPTDIEIRGNYFFKPLTWKPREPGFVGGKSGRPFIVKNLFELKNAQRVLFEGNLLENCWGGFSQNGYAILLSPKNQENRCPACQVTDVTIRYNRIENVGAVFSLINVRSDAGGEATAGERYSIHDVVATGVRGRQYAGSGLFAQLLVAAPPMRNVQIEHVTAFVPRAIFGITNRGQFTNFKIENNVLGSSDIAIENQGGGPANCAFQSERQGPASVFKNCFVESSLTHNLFIGDEGWPKGNFAAKDARDAGIRELNYPQGKPYELCKEKNGECKKASPALHTGADSKDLGADLEKIDQMLANVR